MAELLDLAQRIAGRARKGEQLEAFVTHERNFSIKAYGGEVETLSSSEPRGAGARVITGGRAGFAYTTDMSAAGLKTLLSQARDNSEHATADEAVALAGPWSSPPDDVPGLYDGSQAEVTPDDAPVVTGSAQDPHEREGQERPDTPLTPDDGLHAGADARVRRTGARQGRSQRLAAARRPSCPSRSAACRSAWRSRTRGSGGRRSSPAG